MGKQPLDWMNINFQALSLAWSDAEFKRALLSDPRAALLSYLGYEVPAGVNLVVTEGRAARAGDGVHIVLPSRPAGHEGGRVEVAKAADALLSDVHHCGVCC